MDKTKASILIDLGQLNLSCFVVMPFSTIFRIEYKRIIRPAIEEVGLQCARGDEIYSKPRIMDDIWKCIRASRLVIAELTGKNPNVLYEVGLAQAIGKPIIIITRDEDDVPFDLKAMRYLYYDIQNPFWGDDLKKRIKVMIQNVLEEDGFSTYLEGITATEKLEFPKPGSVEPALCVTENPEPQSVAGVWGTYYKLPDRSVTSITKTLHLTQDGQNLSGLEIITYFRKDVPTIVEQALSGIISGARISLSGVSYTFTHKGEGTDYSLNNYELILTDDGAALKGQNADTHGKLPDVIYKKLSGEFWEVSSQ